MSEPTQVIVAAVDPTFVVVALIIGIVVAVIPWVFRGRCPKCKRFFAMSKTGGPKGGENWDEWVCYYCAHQDWRKVERGRHGQG